ncbi:MAG: hypothetical protein Kow0029_11470 [Candidatus Rifleibacteriota bacterium]
MNFPDGRLRSCIKRLKLNAALSSKLMPARFLQQIFLNIKQPINENERLKSEVSQIESNKNINKSNTLIKKPRVGLSKI